MSGCNGRSTFHRMALVKLLLHRLFGQLPRIDSELLLNHLSVLLVVDLVRKLLESLLNVFVLALLAQQIETCPLRGRRTLSTGPRSAECPRGGTRAASGPQRGQRARG
jgi:hypothetical protein